MALVVPSQSGEIRGSQGGITYSRNRSGAYIRSRVVPVNPNTARQVQMRNIARSLSIAWQNDLTQVQRDAWNVYAGNVTWKNKVGQDIQLTGLNMYLRSNSPRLLFPGGLSRIDAAPVIYTLATAELALSVTASEATQQLTVAFDDNATWATEAGAFQVFYMGRPQNGGIAYFSSPYKKMDAVFGGDPAVSPKVSATAWPFAEGNRIWVRSRIGRADGRLSEFAEYNFLAAA